MVLSLYNKRVIDLEPREGKLRDMGIDQGQLPLLLPLMLFPSMLLLPPVPMSRMLSKLRVMPTLIVMPLLSPHPPHNNLDILPLTMTAQKMRI